MAILCSILDERTLNLKLDDLASALFLRFASHVPLSKPFPPCGTVSSTVKW